MKEIVRRRAGLSKCKAIPGDRATAGLAFRELSHITLNFCLIL
jgi:hypothetical protein